MHHHPKDHRALTKEEVRLRQDKYKLVLAGMLNPYAKLTPALRDQLVGLNRQLNWQPGQRLIRVDYLAR